MKRREFCRQLVLVSGAVVLSPLIKGCAPDGDPTPARGDGPAAAWPTATNAPLATEAALPKVTRKGDPTQAPTRLQESDPTETPQPTAPTAPSMATIALVKTSDRAYGVQQALALLEENPVRGSRVLLKPNYNSVDPAPGSTHPDILRAMVMEMNEMGARSLTVGERSGMGDTRSVLTQTGVFSMGDELGFDTVVLDELDEDDWVVRGTAEYHWQSGFAVPKLLLDSECVVQTCNLKTHKYGGHFTLSLKNSVGFVAKRVRPGGYNYMEELHNSPFQRQLIAEINTTYKPALIVMDGVDAFVDGGPAQGKMVSPGVVLAGTDPVAVDAVGAAILRLFGTTPQVSQGKIFELEQIARAVELGLGIDAPERIRIVTGDAESEAYATTISQFLV